MQLFDPNKLDISDEFKQVSSALHAAQQSCFLAYSMTLLPGSPNTSCAACMSVSQYPLCSHDLQ